MDLGRRSRRFFKVPSLNTLRLRPYGDSLATPAVAVWLGFAWVIILLMASIEGIVWGFVGASIVPQAAAWLRPVAGFFMFVLMFAIIWIVDASLIMSERPTRARGALGGGLRDARPEERGAGARWFFGLLIRVLIVAVSLYVTAPFLAKLIRADDIESYHQRLVEQYYAQRDAAFQAQVAARAGEIETRYGGLIAPLEEEVERLNRSLDAERQRRDQIAAEYTPEITVLRTELAAAQERLGDEIHGRGDRPEGYGPEARKWDARVNALVAALADKQSEIDRRIAEVAQTIADQEERLRARTDELQRIRLEQQERMDRIRAEVAAAQPEELPPRLTFAARSKALQALRESPDEAGVPHFETVEGFAQAALAILFFSLIALKLFEPAAVRAYFSESLQYQYRKYLDGALAGIPGFACPEDPAQRLSPVEFARLWQGYERDPEGHFAEQETRLAAAEPMRMRLADESFAETLMERRRENLDQELDLARRRREIEVAAYENEQRLRAGELRAQLADETRAKHHYRRAELEHELQQARESWALQKAHDEEDMRERMAAFERSIELAREDRRLREKEMEIRRIQREEELRQADVQRLHRHRVEVAELEARRRREERLERLAGMRDELSRLRELETRDMTEASTLREAGYRLKDAIETLRGKIGSSESALASARARMAELKRIADGRTDDLGETARPSGGGFWSRTGRPEDGKGAREARRELKSLEKWLREEGERLAGLSEERRALELRRITHEDQLHEIETRISGIRSRILFHEDAIGTLLTVERATTDDAEV
ncbi:DUF4407 domain-containing protein [Thiocapsa roseopersicina]|uniref:DUF4407 domain-containing protein n=1 Tax=Thiocapsa roseopersicina TaxID=1058 RepID=A0A1H2TWQ8_THIRO|nr:DUF4407 domain-containing protein [Thiocapsa roseopersicina]SDW48373.1 protein of unknown function [Thiocapsa roseopersicina]